MSAAISGWLFCSLMDFSLVVGCGVALPAYHRGESAFSRRVHGVFFNPASLSAAVPGVRNAGDKP